MASHWKKTWQYVKAYRWSNIFAMIKNSRRDPAICAEDFKQKWVVITAPRRESDG